MQFRLCFGALLRQDKQILGSLNPYLIPLNRQAAKLEPSCEKPTHQLTAASSWIKSDDIVTINNEYARHRAAKIASALCAGSKLGTPRPDAPTTGVGSAAVHPFQQLTSTSPSSVLSRPARFGAANAILSGPPGIIHRGFGAATSSGGQRVPQSGEGDDRDDESGGQPRSRSDTPVWGGGAGALELLSPALEERLRRHADRFLQLEQQLASGGGISGSGGGGGGAVAAPSLRDLGREYARLQPLAQGYSRLLQVRAELSDLVALARDPDSGVRAMAAEEEAALRQEVGDLTRGLLLSLVPPEHTAARPALLEVRAGAGGAEAALFASELLAMYRRLAQSRGWTWEVLELGSSEHGGVRHATVAVSDPAAPSHSGSGSGSSAGGGDAAAAGEGKSAEDGVYGVLSGESGVHRVQRVPVTEAGGRLHTSTAAVVVLPQADEVDVRLREEDLRVETMRASGAGGQHVNVTDSAVRVTHLPTGLVVSCQNERSQHLNRAAALKVLRSRLYDLEAQKRARAAGEQRSALVATADRSERVRTYNFPQGRVTDHRIHLTVHDLASVLEAGEGLQRLMEGLRAAKEEAALAALLEEGARQ